MAKAKFRFTVTAINDLYKNDNKTKVWSKGQTYTCVTSDFRTFLIGTNSKAMETVGVGSILVHDFFDQFTTDYRLPPFTYPAAWLNSEDKDRIYREVWAEHVKDDVLHHDKCKDLPESSRTECAKYVARRWVSGSYDCNASYWDNMEALIDDWLNSPF